MSKYRKRRPKIEPLPTKDNFDWYTHGEDFLLRLASHLSKFTAEVTAEPSEHSIEWIQNRFAMIGEEMARIPSDPPQELRDAWIRGSSGDVQIGSGFAPSASHAIFDYAREVLAVARSGIGRSHMKNWQVKETSGLHVMERLGREKESRERQLVGIEPIDTVAIAHLLEQFQSGCDTIVQDLRRLGAGVKREAAFVRSGVPGEPKKDAVTDVVVSPDFRSVRCSGTLYSFTAAQAGYFEVLYTNWLNGAPQISEAFIQSEVESESRARDLFKNSEAWSSIIVPGATKGTLQFKPPDSAG